MNLKKARKIQNKIFKYEKKLNKLKEKISRKIEKIYKSQINITKIKFYKYHIGIEYYYKCDGEIGYESITYKKIKNFLKNS